MEWPNLAEGPTLAGPPGSGIRLTGHGEYLFRALSKCGNLRFWVLQETIELFFRQNFVHLGVNLKP